MSGVAHVRGKPEFLFVCVVSGCCRVSGSLASFFVASSNLPAWPDEMGYHPAASPEGLA